MRKWITATLLSAGMAIFAIQVVQPRRTNPVEKPGRGLNGLASVDPAAAQLLRRSCSDCHSSSTTWPWYSRVAPVSWLVVSDVNRGRRAMNLSEWSGYSPQQQHELVTDICEEVAAGEMAPAIYRLVHSHARLSGGDRQVLCNWARSVAGAPLSSPSNSGSSPAD